MAQLFVEAIQVLLNENGKHQPAAIKAAGDALVSLIQKEEAWSIIINVLKEAASQTGIAHHSAIYLRNKIMFDFHQVNESQLPELRTTILGFIRMYQHHKPTLKQLTVCYADLAINNSLVWTTPMQDLNEAFPLADPSNHVVALNMFVSLAEEMGNHRILAGHEKKDQMRKTLSAATSDVLTFLGNLSAEMLAQAQFRQLATDALALWIPFCDVSNGAKVIHHKLLQVCLEYLKSGDESSIRCMSAVLVQIDRWLNHALSGSDFTSGGGNAALYSGRAGDWDDDDDLYGGGHQTNYFGSGGASAQQVAELRAIKTQFIEILLPTVAGCLQRARADPDAEAEEVLFADLVIDMARCMLRDFATTPFAQRPVLLQQLLEAAQFASQTSRAMQDAREKGEDMSVPAHLYNAIDFWMRYVKLVAPPAQGPEGQDDMLSAEESRLLLSVIADLVPATMLPSTQFLAGGVIANSTVQPDLSDVYNFRCEMFELVPMVVVRIQKFAPFFQSVFENYGGMQAPAHKQEMCLNFFYACCLGAVRAYEDGFHPHADDSALFLQFIHAAGVYLPQTVPTHYVEAALRSRYMNILQCLDHIVCHSLPADSPQFQDLLQRIAHYILLPRTRPEQEAVDEWERMGLQAASSQAVSPLWDVKSAAIEVLKGIHDLAPAHLARHLLNLKPVVVQSKHTLNYDQRKRLFDVIEPAPGEVLQVVDAYLSDIFVELRAEADKGANADIRTLQRLVFDVTGITRAIFSRRDSSFLLAEHLTGNQQLVDFVVQRMWPLIRDVASRYVHDALLFERAMKVLRAPFKLLGADAIRSILPELFTFVVRSFAQCGHSSCVFVADWLGVLMNNEDCLREAAAQMWNVMTSISLRHLDLAPISDEEILSLPGVNAGPIALLPKTNPSEALYHNVLEDLFGLWAHITSLAPLFVLESPLLPAVIRGLGQAIVGAQQQAQIECANLLSHAFKLAGERKVDPSGVITVKPAGEIADLGVQASSVNPAQDRYLIAMQITDKARVVLAGFAPEAVSAVVRVLATDPHQAVNYRLLNILKTIANAFTEEMALQWLPAACQQIAGNLRPEECLRELRDAARSPGRCGILAAKCGDEIARRAFHVQRRHAD